MSHYTPTEMRRLAAPVTRPQSQADAELLLGNRMTALNDAADQIEELDDETVRQRAHIEALEAKVAELTPPLRSEIAAHLEAGGTVEYNTTTWKWEPSEFTASMWRQGIKDYGDLPMVRYRLVPLPETVTLTVELTRDDAVQIRNGGAWRIGNDLASAIKSAAAKALGVAS